MATTQGARYYGADNSVTLTNSSNTITYANATTWVQFIFTCTSGVAEVSLDGTNYVRVTRYVPLEIGPFDPTVFPSITIRPENGTGTIIYDYIYLAY